MKSISELNLKDKKILLRVDFDVPVENGQITEKFRIERQKEMLDYLVGQGAKVVMVAHLGDGSQSFGELMPQLHMLLGYEVNFIKKIEDIQGYLNNYAGPALLENTRQFKGEVENDKEFGQKLVQGFDIYINNCFSTSHRNHASFSAAAENLPAYPGFVLEREVAELEKAVMAFPAGKVIIIGGAKASTKVPVIKNLIDKADNILVGGVVANDILKEKGIDVGKSVVDENSSEILAGLDLNNSKLVIPEDYNISGEMILDIGDKTIENYRKIISSASMIIWNGPMGWFEKPGFEKGTEEIAKAISESTAYKIIGGGDTISAIDKLGLGGKFDPSINSGQIFISTGGGAMLVFLAGDILPGLKVLGYYAR